jgi:hypothetical protein
MKLAPPPESPPEPPSVPSPAAPPPPAVPLPPEAPEFSPPCAPVWTYKVHRSSTARLPVTLPPEFDPDPAPSRLTLTFLTPLGTLKSPQPTVLKLVLGITAPRLLG